MPTYEYKCTACQHAWEEFQSMTADPIKKCPKCKKSKAERQISSGAGIIFRGSGFYETDYRSDSYKKGADSDSKASSTAAASTGSEASSNAKSESSKTGAAKTGTDAASTSSSTPGSPAAPGKGKSDSAKSS